MSYMFEIGGDDGMPVPAGTFRVIAGLLLMVAGFIFGVFSSEPGHGLGLLAFLGSPFLILKDKERRN